LIAVWLVSTFIVWMIQHGNKIKWYVEDKTAKDLSKYWIFIISFIMIAREWVEITIFAFAWDYQYFSIIIWVFISAIIAFTIYFSLLKINIEYIFKITLIYLIIQAGYLLGYWIHEGLWFLNTFWYLSSDNILLVKIYDLSSTIFNHKEGIIWLPLNAIIGWFSNPEWIQFIIQYTYTILLLLYWYKYNKKLYKHKKS
jgi:high-affinity iron transporter